MSHSFSVIALLLPLLMTPCAQAQYLSSADAQRQAASDKNAARQMKIDAVVGKTFWYRPGTSDTFRTEFFEKFGKDPRFPSLEIYDFSGKFFLTKETSFKVIAADMKKLQVEFEDGKRAFIKAHALADYGDYPLIDNLYQGRQQAGSYRSIIYPDVPFKIENPTAFVALDAMMGKKYWYRPLAQSGTKLNFSGEVKTEIAFVMSGYKVAEDHVEIMVQLDDGTARLLRIEKSNFINFSGRDLPFVYVSKDKSAPTREYLYSGPPDEVIAAEEAAIAAQAAAAAREKAAAAEERARLRKEAYASLVKELKSPPKSFEVRGMNLGSDHYQDVAESKGFVSGKGSNVDGFPDTRKEIASDGGVFYFYRDILFMTSYDDLQDTLEIRAAMNQLESKFKGKFANIPKQKSTSGNIETTSTGFRLNIGGFGTAEVQLSATRPISRSVCIDNISRAMRLNISLGIRNYSSLTDRVESECREVLNPTQLVFVNKPIEAIVNARATAERQAKAREAVEEKLKTATDKAKKF